MTGDSDPRRGDRHDPGDAPDALPPQQQQQQQQPDTSDDEFARLAVRDVLRLLNEPSDDDIVTSAGIHGGDPLRFERYRLIRPIGEGGFGMVFLAEQTEPVLRHVALKIIKPGMDSRAVIARFEAERQALAMMNHQHVARVLDAGTTERGLPFFVMEYVQGDPVTTYCDHHRLGLRARLELFLDICDAIQHAHQKAIIHRDIKPQNVLVATSERQTPIVKVIDFGVAKALSQPLSRATLMTTAGQLVGTPEYMSPEQADTSGVVDIDTRSDVYALGVLLYELLAGARPFDLGLQSLEELRRAIREVDPPRPATRLSSLGEGAATIAQRRGMELSALRQQLRGELAWIPLKAMRKDRSERYGSAADLADDVRNYLARRALAAGPESTAYRLQKYIRRHRGPVLAAAAIVVALAGGLALATGGLIKARRAELVATERAQDLEAVVSFQDRLLRDVDPSRMGPRILSAMRERVKTELTDSGLAPEDVDARLAALDDLTSRISSTGLAVVVLDEEILARAEQTVNQGFDGHPLVEATLRQSLASIFREMGLYERAAVHQDRALELREAHLGTGHVDTIRSRVEKGWLLSAAGRIPESWCDDTARLAYAHLGPDHPVSIEADEVLGLTIHLNSRSQFDRAESLLTSVYARRAQRLGKQSEMTLRAVSNLGQFYRDRGEWARSASYFRQAGDGYAALFGPEDRRTLIAQSNLAREEASLGHFKEAESLSRSVVGPLERTLGPDHPDTIRASRTRGGILAEMGRLEEAELVLAESLHRLERVLGPDHFSTWIALNRLGLVRMDRGQFNEAEAAVQESLRRRRASLGEDHYFTLDNLSDLAGLRIEQGRYGDAEALCREVLAKIAGSAGMGHPVALRAQRILGQSLIAAGHFDDAATVLDEALQSHLRLFGDDHPDSLGIEEAVAVFDFQMGRLPAATARLESTLEHAQAALGPGHPDTLRIMKTLGTVRLARGDGREAEQLLQASLEGRRQLLGPTHPDTIRSEGAWATYLIEFRGVPAEAASMIEACVRTSTTTLGERHPLTLWALAELGRAYAELGHYEGALDAFSRSARLRAEVLGSTHPATLWSRSRMGDVQRQLGLFEDAEETLTQCAAAYRESLGDAHPDTLRCEIELALLLTDTERYTATEAQLIETLEKTRAALGGDSDLALRAESALADLYVACGRYTEAEPVRRRVADSRQAQLGSRHPETLRAQLELADLWLDQARYDEAASAFREAHAIAAAALGQG
ncbi:MAG: tetratricopeptide repeat protein, partial [Phycisphaerales bacterium]|nr:tetratricopeptide repeat protein [Phycisphaerales bacterium]